MGDNLGRSVAMLFLIPIWLELHGWVVHRILHPWGILGAADPGKVLYHLVHSVRHRSESPGPWSAFSMSPIEYVLVFSVYVFPFFVPLHPLHIHYFFAYSRLAPIAESDGFDRPCGGD